MKKSKVLILLSLLGLTLPSCGKIDAFFNTLETIYIKDYRNAYYKDSSFLEKNELEMFAKYKNGTIVPLTFNDVSSYLYNEYGLEENIATNFTYSGRYAFRVKMGAIYSNTIFLNVDENIIYVNNIDVTVSSFNTRTMDIEIFEINVSPANYNVDLEVEFTKPESTVVTREEGKYYFYFEEAGEQTLTVKAKSGSSTYVSNSYPFTVSDASGKFSIAQTYKTLSTRNSPTIGDIKFLIIPIWLTDSSIYIPYDRRENVREDINRVFFSNSLDLGCESVSSFYNYESGGLFNLSGTVANWYESNKSIADIGYQTDLNPSFSLVNEAVNEYFINNPEDKRTNYDYDGDGFIDGVVTIYGAPDYYASGVDDQYRAYTNLWAYCAWYNLSADKTNPRLKNFLWASYDFMYGYSTSLERTGKRIYKGNTTYCKLDTHTYLHETGHLLGLEDYYDYNKTDNNSNPVGGFTMQDSNVGGHDPYSVLTLGWGKPMLPTSSSRIKLHTFQESKEMIILTPEWNTYDSPFDEYVILELYAPSGLNNFDTIHRYAPANESSYPQGADKMGIRVWHVDARLTHPVGGKYTTNLFTNANELNPSHAFSNTTYNHYLTPKQNEHISPIYDSDMRYTEFDLLHLIRNVGYTSYRYNPTFSNDDLFNKGDFFSMNVYGSQFARKTLFNDSEGYVLDSGKDLGWSFYIEEIKDNYAIIDLYKL